MLRIAPERLTQILRAIQLGDRQPYRGRHRGHERVPGDAFESWHAARPATPSSMPGGASCGTPASCTTGCGWWRRLVKHLLIDWREGEKWFCDTLVDADAASNPANWQWVAGS